MEGEGLAVFVRGAQQSRVVRTIHVASRGHVASLTVRGKHVVAVGARATHEHLPAVTLPLVDRLDELGVEGHVPGALARLGALLGEPAVFAVKRDGLVDSNVGNLGYENKIVLECLCG